MAVAATAYLIVIVCKTSLLAVAAGAKIVIATAIAEIIAISALAEAVMATALADMVATTAIIAQIGKIYKHNYFVKKMASTRLPFDFVNIIDHLINLPSLAKFIRVTLPSKSLVTINLPFESDDKITLLRIGALISKVSNTAPSALFTM